MTSELQAEMIVISVRVGRAGLPAVTGAQCLNRWH